MPYSLLQHQKNLLKIKELQPSLQPLAEQLVLNAASQGVPLRVVQAKRDIAYQQALYDSGAGVTNAPGGLSYHNYALAFDVVPEEYLPMKDWNPGGALWEKVGSIGKALGLEWGGDWKKKDKPHFQVPSGFAPIRELKAYWDKFGKIMDVDFKPALGGIAALAIVAVILFKVMK